MNNILLIIFLLNTFLSQTAQTESTGNQNDPKIVTSYSSVTKQIPHALPQAIVPQAFKVRIPVNSKTFNPIPDRSIKVTSFLTKANDIQSRKNKAKSAVRRFDHQDWLDPENVSSEKDFFNSTAKAMEYLMELNASANQRTKKENRNTSFLCSESFGDEEFFIRSSNYPFNYPAFTTCEYTIKRRNDKVCGIIFTILRFDLGGILGSSSSLNSCSGDKLLIGNQVICGRLRRGTESFYRFTWPTLKITFSSGNGFGASGFLIKGRQTDHCLPEKPFPKPLTSSIPCNRIISETTFNLSSPSYPGDYPHELECHYEVIQANWNICGLLLTPSHFILEGASYCMFDYVEIQGKRLCGNRTSPEPLYYMFEDDKINIRFRTDESVSNNGFSIEGKQVKCDDLEYFQPIHSPLNSVDSVRESKAENDLHDLEDISHALSFLVKSGARQNEQLTSREPKTFFINDEDDLASPFLVSSSPIINLDDDLNNDKDNTTLNINYIPDLVNNPTRNTSFVRPLQQSLEINKDKSFLARSCDEQHSSKVFFIKSVNYPNVYPNDIQCTYYIQRSSPNVCQLRITLENVSIEKSSNSSECIADYLDITGYKVCGEHKKSIMYVTFTGENVILRFKSDSKISDKGYLIQVEQLDEDCGKRDGRERKMEDVPCDSIIRYDNFTIFSPGYPQRYPPNLVCSTTVFKSNPDIKSMEIELQEFAVESSPQCENDYLSIGKLRFCGHRNGNSYVVPFLGESIPLTFVTNEEKSSTGFRIKINQISEQESKSITPKCGGIYYSSTVTLTSPQFPSNYDTDQHCIYTIVRNSPDICQLQFKIIHFDIEASPGCRTDYLQLGLRRLCGRSIDNEIHYYHFKSEKFSLIFHSDLHSSGRGFKIEARQRSCQKKNDGSLLSESTEGQKPPQTIEENTVKRPLTQPNFIQNAINIQTQHGINSQTNIKPSLVINNNKNVLEHSDLNLPSTDKLNASNCNCRFYGIENISDKQYVFYRPQNSVIKPKGCNRCKLYPINNPYVVKHSFYQIESAESVNTPQVIKPEDTNKFIFRPITKSHNQGTGQKIDNKLQNVAHKGGIWIYKDWVDLPNQINNHRSHISRPNPFVNRHHSGRALIFPIDPHTAKLTSNNLVSEKKDTLNTLSQSASENIEEIAETNLNNIQDFSSTLKLSTLNLGTATNGSIPINDSLLLNIPALDLLQVPTIHSTDSAENQFRLQLEKESPNFDQSLKLCNKSISTHHFEMKSPGYPGPFYIDMHCFYLIYRTDSSHCGLFLNIDMLDLPGTPPCLKTYLSVSGRRFCGTKRNGIKVVVPFSPKAPVVIEFRSDMFLSGAGFSLTAEQVPCNFSFVPGQKVFLDDLENQAQQNPATSLETSATEDNTILASESRNILSKLRLEDSDSSKQQKEFQNLNLKPAIRTFARGIVTVPWSGVRGVRNPPYKRGLQLVKLRKAELRNNN